MQGKILKKITKTCETIKYTENSRCIFIYFITRYNILITASMNNHETQFPIHWLHILEFAIIAGSIQYLANNSHNILLKGFAYLNIYIFFMFTLNTIEHYVKPFLEKHIKNKEKCTALVHICTITISLIIVAALTALIIETINDHSITDLKH